MRPFQDWELAGFLEYHVREAIRKINALDNSVLRSFTALELTNRFITEATIEPLVLHSDRAKLEYEERAMFPISEPSVSAGSDEPGTIFAFSIPFEGNSDLWQAKLLQASFPVASLPDIEVLETTINVIFRLRDSRTQDEPLDQLFKEGVSALESALKQLNAEVDVHNANAPSRIMTSVQSRLSTAESIAGSLASLGISLEPREHIPAYSVPLTRKVLGKSPLVGISDTMEITPEPSLDIGDYHHILEVLRSMSLVVERNPNSFKSLGEEAIRDLFLVILNSHYEGTATGETFNANGKTDILIRERNRNIFIAECKFWSGQAAFLRAIDQLLGYLTWRDSKCALVVFNRNKDSSAVSDTMHNVVQEHPSHQETISYTSLDGGKYIFAKSTEPRQLIMVSTLIFDVPADQ